MPSKSLNTMPMQAKIGDASLKFGPDWLRALSSDNSTGSNSGVGSGGGHSGGGWSTGSGGGGERSITIERERSNTASYHYQSSSRDREKDLERRYSNNISSNNTGTSPTLNPNRFKLSEFQYAREELLTLYDKNLQAPDYLPTFGNLFVEKMQPPLSFSQPSEEELRNWHIPQPESSRQRSDGPMGPGLSPSNRGSGSYSVRGRAGVDRGGRGGGRGGRGGYYSRPHEEEDRSYRQHAFVRSQSVHERIWVPERERNGLSGSPPENENRSGGGGNWRIRNSDSYSKRYDDGDDGWRSKSRWRRDEEEEYTPRSSTRRTAHRSWSEDGNHDIPEWAINNPSEESGTFDASGAFHDEGRYSYKGNESDVSRRSETGEQPRESKEASQGSQHERVQKRITERNEMKILPPSTSLKEEEEDDEDEEEEEEEEVALVLVEEAAEEETIVHSSDYNPKSLSPDSSKDERMEDDKSLPQENHLTPEPEEPSVETTVKSVDEDPHYRSMIEEADSLVAKLIADDAAHLRPEVTPQPIPAPPVSSVNSTVGTPQSLPPPSTLSTEIWYYRDPQGNVQGPFASSEMFNWLHQGYFSGGLFLRRECDKIFITLSDMGKLYGRNPFNTSPDSVTPPPLQEPNSGTSALLDPLVDSILNPQIHAQFLQKQPRQVFQAQHQHQQYLRSVHQNPNSHRKEAENWSAHAGGNPAQLQQAQLLLNNFVKSSGVGSSDGVPNDLQSLFQRPSHHKSQQEKNVQDFRTNPPTHLVTQPDVTGKGMGELDPIQSLIHQLTNMTNAQSTVSPLKPSGNGWGSGSGGNSWNSSTATTAPNNPAWDYRDQYLKLQQMKAEEELMARKKLEEEQERKRLQEEDETRKRIEEQKRLEIEQEQKRLAYEEMMQQQQAELNRQREELLLQQRIQQQELVRQRMEQDRLLEQQRLEAIQQLEQQRLEQQRAEQQRVEQQRLEQQRIEQQRLEQQRLQQQRLEQLRLEKEREEEREREREREREEQERHLKMELEEQKRREERRQQQEAHAKKLFELQQQQLQQQQQSLQQKMPWNTSSGSQVPRTLLEIQEEEILRYHREEALKAQQLAQKKRSEDELRASQQPKGVVGGLTWAQPIQLQHVPIKSLAEIQAEEAADLEVKRREREVQTRHLTAQHQAWSSSMTWANRASLNAPPPTTLSTTKGGSSGTVWDEKKAWSTEKETITSNKQSPHSSTPSTKPHPGQKETPNADSIMKLFQDHVGTRNNANTTSGSTASSTGRAQSGDDQFTRWCLEVVEGIGGSVDVPTFINFLKEVESPFEVNDYVRSYLGDGKDARDFAREFIERRSRWKTARRGGDKEGKSFEDNLCRPASALNPPSTEFQEVKGKKGKKGKMQKVDARILGFNTTAAPDRLNVGKRDYGDGSDN